MSHVDLLLELKAKDEFILRVCEKLHLAVEVIQRMTEPFDKDRIRRIAAAIWDREDSCQTS